jgi:hypothetical protein
LYLNNFVSFLHFMKAITAFMDRNEVNASTHPKQDFGQAGARAHNYRNLYNST